MLNTFKENFNRAREFNRYLKLGETAKLVMAPVLVEKKEEPAAKKAEEKKTEEKKPEEKKPEEKKPAENELPKPEVDKK